MVCFSFRPSRSLRPVAASDSVNIMYLTVYSIILHAYTVDLYADAEVYNTLVTLITQL